MGWKFPQFSAWLKTYIFAGCVLSTVPFFLVQWHKTGGNLQAALLAYARQIDAYGGTEVQWIVGVLLSAGLAWFTFCSGSSRVTKDDQRAVRIMFVAGGVSLAVWLAEHFFGYLR